MWALIVAGTMPPDPGAGEDGASHSQPALRGGPCCPGVASGMWPCCSRAVNPSVIAQFLGQPTCSVMVGAGFGFGDRDSFVRTAQLCHRGTDRASAVRGPMGRGLLTSVLVSLFAFGETLEVTRDHFLLL